MASNHDILKIFVAERSKYKFEDYLATEPMAKALIERVVKDYMDYFIAEKDLNTKYPDEFLVIITQRHEFLYEECGFTNDDLEAVKKVLEIDLLQSDYVELAADKLLPPLATLFIAHVTGLPIKDVTIEALPKYFLK